VITFDAVSKVYPGGVAALRDVTLRIEEGELVGIVGPSGSGKSSLLHLMGALDRPTAGEVSVAGHRLARLSDAERSAVRAHHIGFVFQQFHLAPGVSALDNVADGLLYTGVGRANRLAAARNALGAVGLAHRGGHRPDQLSGGERQRVAFARAIVGSPRVLLADEPTGNLDSSSGAAVMQLLQARHAAGTTVVVITHNQSIAESFPRRISILDGSVLA
jgi:putative ABC transport system ATP-binding protein